MNGKAWAASRFLHKDDGERGGKPGEARRPRRDVAEESRELRLSAFLRGLELGTIQQVDRLELVPLIWPASDGGADLLFHEAAAKGLVEVRELEGGVVQEVRAVSRADVPILILEGETLVGCKQNRVVAVTILIPPRADVVVPVGCMERGRWAPRGARFSAGGSKMGAHVRYDSVRNVVRQRSSGIAERIDQGSLWRSVACEIRRDAVHSPTEDYHALLESRAGSVRDRAASFVVVRHQVGAIALWNGRLLGVELVGSAATWAAVAGRAVPAYVLAADAAEASGDQAPPPLERAASEWLEALAAGSVTSRPSRGLGFDLAVRGDRVEAAALWHMGRPAHLIAVASRG